jgi:ADP-ribosylglycohydrolase
MVIGAIIGDIIGSRFEFNPHKTKEFDLFASDCNFTDDTVHTVALADAILSHANYADKLKEYTIMYPNRGYGGYFYSWAKSRNNQPYNSFGNGAAMRISPVGWAFNTLKKVLSSAEMYTAVTHNHPEGIKGGQAIAACIFLARTGKSKQVIHDYIEHQFHYSFPKSIAELRPSFEHDETCQNTVPPAIQAFLEAENFEDAIRIAISLGGDSDTIACITGSIAAAFYPVPSHIRNQAWAYLDQHLGDIVKRFELTFIDK